MPIWTDAIEEAYASAPIDEIILHTIELRHTSFPQPVRVVRDHGSVIVVGDPDIFGHVLRLEPDAPVDPGADVDFVACMFDFSLPGQQEGQLPVINVSLDNVTREIQALLDDAVLVRAPLELTYREYLASDPLTVQFKLDGLFVKSVKGDVFRITGTASFVDLINSSFPKKFYTPTDYPGLRR